MTERDEAAFKCFRELVPYLEHDQALDLFNKGKTTTGEAFKRGWDAGIEGEWKEISKWKPFLHWCRDWDFLLIDKGDAEFEACTCFKKLDSTKKAQRAIRGPRDY